MKPPAQIEIAGHPIGPAHPPFVIAEAGINHNGDHAMALRMIEAAKAAGADAVKFQTFRADEFVADASQLFTYPSQGKTVTEPMLDLFRRHEFSRPQWAALRRRCDEVGIIFLSTAQNRTDLDLLLDIGIPAIKVGSDDFDNLPQLRDFAGSGLPMLLSCGMADMGDVYRSLEAVGALDGYPVVLLQCTSQYPTPREDVNLLKLRTLGAAFPCIPLGFSDHTQGPLASALAVAFGACVFEKHFTLDHGLPGPDHWFSEDPAGLKSWVSQIREAHLMLGSAVVRPTTAERTMRALARRRVVALADIAAGTELSGLNIGLKRAASGLSAEWFDRVTGRRAARLIRKGEAIDSGDFS